MNNYFSLYELIHSDTAIKAGIENIPNWEEMEKLKELKDTILNPIREVWGSGISVNSGYRCERLNDLVKGSKTSQHRYGEAADIEARNGRNKDLFDVIVYLIDTEKIKVGQLINEHNYSWIHISLPTYEHQNEIFKIN